MPEWSGFSYIVTNLARFIRPHEITFSGVNSALPMLACLLAKRAYDFDFTYINVAGGVDPTPVEDANLQLRSGAGRGLALDLRQRGLLRPVHARTDGPVLPRRGAGRWGGRTNVSAIGDWHAPRCACPAAAAAP